MDPEDWYDLFERSEPQTNWLLYINKYIKDNPHFGMSKSWLKMWDFIHRFDIKPTNSVFFNAELPGGFFCAWKHWLDKRDLPDWKLISWYPRNTDTNLFDIYNLKNIYPDNVLYGIYKTNYGNIWFDNDCENMKSIMLSAKYINKKYDLFTSDGGKNCINYRYQEQDHIKMKQGEIYMSLYMLKEGGTSFIKFYALRTEEMLKLLSAYIKLFDKYTFFKPFGSNPLNKEIYGVFQGFKNISTLEINDIDVNMVKCIDEVWEQREISVKLAMENKDLSFTHIYK